MLPNDDSKPLTLGDFKKLMANHECAEFDMKQELLDKFMSAFPDGKPEPHREYHEAKINAAKAEKEAEESRKKFYDAALSKVLEKGIEGAFGVLKILVVIGILSLTVKLGIAIPGWLLK